MQVYGDLLKMALRQAAKLRDAQQALQCKQLLCDVEGMLWTAEQLAAKPPMHGCGGVSEMYRSDVARHRVAHTELLRVAELQVGLVVFGKQLSDAIFEQVLLLCSIVIFS